MRLAHPRLDYCNGAPSFPQHFSFFPPLPIFSFYYHHLCLRCLQALSSSLANLILSLARIPSRSHPRLPHPFFETRIFSPTRTWASPLRITPMPSTNSFLTFLLLISKIACTCIPKRSYLWVLLQYDSQSFSKSSLFLYDHSVQLPPTLWGECS